MARNDNQRPADDDTGAAEERATPRTEVMDSSHGPGAGGLEGAEVERELEALRAAQRQARYIPINEIARGGMGTVLEVWDRVIQRRVAKKVLRADGLEEGSGDSSRTVARFLREARITGQIPHPGVVPIHDIECEDGQVAFTMDLIEGRTFEQAFGNLGPEPEDGQLTRALLALIAVCDVMSYAHAKRVIHRDLKPANIMVGGFGETYVVDWGLAKVLQPDADEDATEDSVPTTNGVRLTESMDGVDAGHTLDGSVVGTPSFMSPEQAEGRVHEVGVRSDVYSIGAVLYRVLTGRNPYASADERNDPSTIIELVRRGPPTPILKLNRKAPAELVSVCEMAMSRNPEDRYASMTELANDLRAFLDGHVVAAYEEGLLAGFKKLVLRNRAVVASIATAALAVVGAMIAVTVIHAGINHQLQEQNEQLEVARSPTAPCAKLRQWPSACGTPRSAATTPCRSRPPRSGSRGGTSPPRAGVSRAFRRPCATGSGTT